MSIPDNKRTRAIASHGDGCSGEIAFTVPGQPRGKGRPRFGRTKAGHAIAFTDRQTAAYESLVALAAQQAMRGQRPFADAVDLNVRIRLVPAASTPKGQRAAMLSGEIAPAKRPDADNILKAISDGLNGIAYVDDAQIVGLNCRKVYAETPGVDVLIKPYQPENA